MVDLEIGWSQPDSGRVTVLGKACSEATSPGFQFTKTYYSTDRQGYYSNHGDGHNRLALFVQKV